MGKPHLITSNAILYVITSTKMSILLAYKMNLL